MSNTCGHCRTVSEDVVWQSLYRGGSGYVAVLICMNTVECWDRWNVQHGFKAQGYIKAGIDV
jgi:hypothetical protein